jgi:hypothetical protein
MRLGRLHPGRVALHRLGCLVLALGAFASLLLSGSAAAAGSDRRMHDEIQYLLLSVERSGCEFYRNGSWHPGPEARAHLTRKYEATDAKGLILTTDDFIRRVATESSLSGTPYRVRCLPAEPMASEAWFRRELARYRDEHRPGQ